MQFNMIMDFSQGTQSRFPSWTVCGLEGNGKGYNATYCHWENEGLSEQGHAQKEQLMDECNNHHACS